MKAGELGRTRQLYQPELDAMRALLPDMGAALDAALCDLSRDLSAARIDEALMKLEVVKQNLAAMCRLKAESRKPR